MVISYAMVLCLPQVTRCDVYFLNLDKFVQLNGIVTVMEHIFRYMYICTIYSRCNLFSQKRDVLLIVSAWVPSLLLISGAGWGIHMFLEL